MTVLDPSVGTGEFLREAQHRCPEVNAVGWDIDPKVLDAARLNVPTAELQRVIRHTSKVCPSNLRTAKHFRPVFYGKSLGPKAQRDISVCSANFNEYWGVL